MRLASVQINDFGSSGFLSLFNEINDVLILQVMTEQGKRGYFLWTSIISRSLKGHLIIPSYLHCVGIALW